MRKSSFALYAFLLLPIATQAYGVLRHKNPAGGTVIVRDGYPFKKGSVFTTKLLPNCEDSDGNIIRTSDCLHLETNTKGWAAHLESACKAHGGSDLGSNPSGSLYVVNGASMWIAQEGDKKRDFLLYNKTSWACDPAWIAQNGGSRSSCKIWRAMENMFKNGANPKGVDGSGGDASSDNLNAIYDPTTDRYFEFYKYAQPGWTVSITQANPSIITTFDTTGAETKHGIETKDQIRFWSTGALPGGLDPNVIYYAIPLTDTTFQVSATPGGPPVETTGGAQSGVQSAINTSRHVTEFGGVMENASSWDGIWTKSIDGDGNVKFVNPSRGDARDGMIVGSNAVGISVMMTTVSIAELEAGLIQHAVGLVVPESWLGEGAPYQAHSWPATKNDSYGGGTRKSQCNLPEGARLRLDPDIWTDDYIDNVYRSPYGGSPPTKMVKTIMRAARDYGFVITDTGSNCNVRGQNPGFKGVVDYNGKLNQNGWNTRLDSYGKRKSYASSQAYNQYPEYLPGDPYYRRDGKGIFAPGIAWQQPGTAGGNAMAAFPWHALQLIRLKMNDGWPKPKCTCSDYTGLGVKTKNPVLHPCWSNP